LTSSISLYIHIPFCDNFCDYCDFYSVKKETTNQDYIDSFLSAVITDIKHQIDFFSIGFFSIGEIKTVYIGGGTPSVLGKRIKILLDALKKIDGFAPLEFTVEANPESLNREFLEVCAEGGVNRLSLGVQTFYEPSRMAVNRFGNTAILEKRLALASSFFPDSLSVDLVTGLPYHDEKVVKDDLKRLLDFNPAHVSLYSLTVENDTPLEKKIKSKEITLPDKDVSDSLWLNSRDILKESGFCHYEISNFAKNGKMSIHNLRYWRMEGWLGAGPGASGTIIDDKTGTAKRYTYAADVDLYKDEPFIHTAICEELDKPALMRESLLMGFRYSEGPDKTLFKQRFGCVIEDCIPQTLERWQDRDKMLFLNSFLSEAFLELDKRMCANS